MVLALTPAFATVHKLPTRDAEPTDAELVTRILAGDRHAEERLYLRHVGYVTSLCLRLLGRRDEAEDAAQDTFVDVLEQLHRLREPQRLKHWITRIAVHKAHRRFRRRKLLRTLGLYGGDPVEETLLPANNERSTQEQAIELEKLSSVLQGLPDVQRAAWVLRYVDGHKLEQVAALCDCSLATAKRRIAAADAIVREHVQLVVQDDL
jgi:RNA polymerase sigma-70 factor (ECF subfamily)